MDKDRDGPRATFHSVNSNIIAGNDINIVTVNKVESSISNRLKTALNPVTSASYDCYDARQRSECFPNTRLQVLNDIEAWIHSESNRSPVYVLDGVAGIGKSTVAQTIAVRIAALGLLGGSFFFSRDEDQRKVARYFFPTIAFQLGCYDDQFATSISQSLEQNPDAPTKRLYQQMLLLLLEPLEDLLSQRSKPVLLVVDALDECEEESAEELLSLLGQHAHRLKGLKILITTRPEERLRDVLDEDENHESFRLHDIEDSIVHSDIRLYLQSHLSVEETRKASRNRQEPWQPTTKDMDMLCGICGTLFIIAATAVKFILDRRRLNPGKQLAYLLDGVSESGFTGSKHTNVLDQTYLRVIFAAWPDPDEDWFRDLNKVLGALLALANPLPCSALASLLDMNRDDIEATLLQLHSLVAPSGKGETMTFRIHHKSFPDFITNRERIRQALGSWKSGTHSELDSDLWVDMSYQHLQLAKACFRIMNCNLRWNMADINEEDWYKDRDDLPHVVPQLISGDLAYVAPRWASHLLSAHALEKDLELQKCIHVWTSTHLLAWIEVMVILERVDDIYDILQNAIKSVNSISVTDWTERTKVQELLSDVNRFVRQGMEVMNLSPIHIYRSCLPFTPIETSLDQAYDTSSMLKVGSGRSHQWNRPLLATLIGHSHYVDSVAFSADGSRLASGSMDSTIRVWDAQTGAHILTLTGHQSPVHSVEFSRDGSRLASAAFSDPEIIIWDAKTGGRISTLTGHTDEVQQVTWSSKGCVLASASQDKTIRLWDTKTDTLISTLSGHSDTVSSVAFSSDGGQLVSGSWDQTVRIWDVNTGAHISTLSGHSAEVYSVAISGDDSRLASLSLDATIRLWDAKTGAHIHTFEHHSATPISVAFSVDGSRLAVGSREGPILFYDVNTTAHIFSFIGHSNTVRSVAFSMDGFRLASGSQDNTIILWDATVDSNTSTPSFTGHAYEVTSVVFSNDGSLLASGSKDETIQLWDTKTGVNIFTLAGDSGQVFSVVFSGDGKRLASGSLDGSVRLWDTNTGDLIFTFTGDSIVRSVAFSEDGSRLAAESEGYIIRLWDAKTGACISALTFSTGILPSLFSQEFEGSVLSVAFSSDGSRLAVGYMDCVIQLWDPRTGACISTITRHSRWVTSVAFSTNGYLLASGSHDGTIQLWDARTCAHISTLIVPQESRIKTVVFLHNNSRIIDRVVPSKSRPLKPSFPDPACLLLLVERWDPPLTGLMMVNLISEAEDGLKWEVFPLCWFPPDIEVGSLAVNHATSEVAVGCKNGSVMMLDLCSDFPKSD